MNKSLIFVTLALAALLAAPATTAAPWMSHGSVEPDTKYDKDVIGRGLMWQDRPGAANNRVYFNVYVTQSNGAGGGMNPNVGALGTAIEVPLLEQQYGVLGVWTDCNGDGYIGLAESAAREYRSELLGAGNTLCPAKSGGTNCWVNGVSPCPNWPATGHNNYNGWVTELIPIGSGETSAGDRRVIKDVGAAVWGDFGRPGQNSTTAGGTCAISPPPRGSLQTTGGLLTYAECRFGLLELFNLAVDRAGNPGGLRFANDDDGRSGTLGQFQTLGSTDSNRAIVKTQDCSAPVLVRWSSTPLGGEIAKQTKNDGIRSPGTTVNSGGTVAGTVNYTFESGPFPTAPGDAQNNPETSDCNTSNDYGEQPYSIVEGKDFSSTNATDKRESIWNFGFQTMTRGGVPLGGLTGAAGGPSDAGLEPANAACTVCQESEWFGGSTLTKTGTPPGPRTLAVRADLGNADIGVDIAGAYWQTFYAAVGSTTTGSPANGLTPGGSGTYGKEQCGSFTSGIHGGWNCDPLLWNRDPSGGPKDDPFNSLARPGKTYQFRDADCYDGRIGETGIGVLPAFHGQQPCRAG